MSSDFARASNRIAWLAASSKVTGANLSTSYSSSLSFSAVMKVSTPKCEMTRPPPHQGTLVVISGSFPDTKSVEIHLVPYGVHEV